MMNKHQTLCFVRISAVPRKWWYIQVFVRKFFNIISNATIYSFALTTCFFLHSSNYIFHFLCFFRSSCQGSKILLGWVLDSGALALAETSILAYDFFTGLTELNSLQMLLNHKNSHLLLWIYNKVLKLLAAALLWISALGSASQGTMCWAVSVELESFIPEHMS